jgi:hypothetical protein
MQRWLLLPPHHAVEEAEQLLLNLLVRCVRALSKLVLEQPAGALAQEEAVHMVLVKYVDPVLQ